MDGNILEDEYEIPVNIEKEINETFKFSVNENEESIYKGKLYSKENRIYSTINKVEINYTDKASKIVLNENINFDVMASNIEYISTKIDKEEIKNILGKNGYIVIKDINGNELTKITKDSECDEDGNVIFNYERGTQNIVLEIYGAEKTGILNIKNDKNINTINYTKENIARIGKIIENIKGTYYLGEAIEKEEEETKEIELKETETKAKIEINNNILSTYAKNENIELKATLITNNEDKDLYKNPTIQIVLPSIIEKIDIKTVKLMYAEALKVKSATLENKNGEKVINIAFEGEQAQYTNLSIAEGPTIIVNADINVNKKALSQENSIKLNYTNENDKNNQEQEECKIQVISPREILTVNSINALGLETVGEEETKNAELEINSNAKDLQVQVQIANNAETDISNVKILGDFPTQGAVVDNEENNMQVELTNNIQVNTLQTSKSQIYYSQNTNATDELENSQNGWVQDSTNAKKYLIVVDNMQKGQDLTATYDVKVAENLSYNERAKANYEVSYSNNQTGKTLTLGATPIAMETEEQEVAPNIEASLTATAGNYTLKNGDEVKEGERIKYTINVTNNGTGPAQNVTVTASVPDNTIYVEMQSILDSEFTGQNFSEWKEVEDKKQFIMNIDAINAGETKTFEYEVKVKKGIVNNTEISNKAIVNYNNTNLETNQLKTKLVSSDINLMIYRSDYLQNEPSQGQYLTYIIEVQNTSSQDKNNVSLNIDTTDLFTIKNIRYYDEDSDTTISENNTKQIKINKIKANSIMYVKAEIYVELNDINDNNKIQETVVTIQDANNTYRSNKLSEKVNITKVNITKSSNKANQDLHEGDILEYFITVTNNSDDKLNDMNIYDIIPKDLNIMKVVKDDEILINYEEQYNEDTGSGIETCSCGCDNCDGYYCESCECENCICKNELQECMCDCENCDGYDCDGCDCDNCICENQDEEEEVICTCNCDQCDGYECEECECEDCICKKDIYLPYQINDNQAKFTVDLDVGESTDILIKTIVKYSESFEDSVISNTAYIESNEGILLDESNEVTNIVVRNDKQTDNENKGDNDKDNDSTNKEDNDGNSNGNNNNESENGKGENTSTYSITGTAWLDENGDGKKDEKEKLLNDITVKIYNVTEDKIENNIYTSTSNSGKYILSNLSKGQYIIMFEYDTNKYMLTTYNAQGVSEEENSDAVEKTIVLQGQEKTVGATDIINIENSNIYNIDIGLIEAKKFDLKLDKYISKIIIQNSEGTKTYDYTNTQLAKIDIAAKQLKGTNVIITYTMKVTNQGEVAGYVKSIYDTLPKDLKFSSELNKDWYESDSYLYNESLENTKLESGQTAEVSLVLTKTMTDTNTGTTNNIAEISKASNDLGVKDVNSTPGNKTRGENDMSSADVIISIKTGVMVKYIALTLCIIITIGIGAYFISKRILKIKV